MGYLGFLFFIPFFLMPLLAVAQNSTAESLLFPKQYCILQRGNYTDNSTYQADLDGLLSSFSNTTVDFGFYNSSAGEVNAMGLCRADLTPDSCRTCISSSVHLLRRSCPNYKEAIIYNRTCMLRYSDRSIFGLWESNPLLITFTVRHFTNVSQTKPIVLKLLTHLYDEAASGGPLRKYAVGEAVSGFDSTYALVQCTPNLPEQKCRDCLEDLHGAVPYRFERSGLFLIGPSCNFRYASFRFYQSVSDGPSSSPSPSSSLSPSPSPSPTPTPTTNDTTGNGT